MNHFDALIRIYIMYFSEFYKTQPVNTIHIIMNKQIRTGRVVELIGGNWGKIVYPSRSSVFTVNVVHFGP